MPQSQKKAILCPNCRKLIGQDELFCPFCSTRNPGSWTKNNPVTRSIDDAEKLIKTIIYLNVGMFALTVLLNPWSMKLSFNPLTFFAPELENLLLLGATGTIPIDRYFRWWTLLSANFLHGGLLHIAFNMIALKQLSVVVIREYGGHRMILIYVIGGAIGFYVSYLAGVRFTIGASAAVCSLMGALLYYGKSRGGLYGQVIYKQVAAWAVSLFIFGLLVPGINNWGHGGGIAGGILLGFLLGYREKKPDNSIARFLAYLCAGITGLVLLWAVATGIYFRLTG